MSIIVGLLHCTSEDEDEDEDVYGLNMEHGSEQYVLLSDETHCRLRCILSSYSCIDRLLVIVYCHLLIID